jgi:hypothetical protein
MLKMKEKIAILLLGSAARKHLRIAKHLRWLLSTIHNDWGSPSKVKKEKEILESDAEKHENAARRIEKIINLYNANKPL